MGKVYDALRKAEEQRARRVREVAGQAPAPVLPDAPAPAAPVLPDAPAPAAPTLSEAPAPATAGTPPAAGAALLGQPAGSVAPPRPGLLGRILHRRPSVHAETAADLNKRRIALLQPESFVAEQFRTLRARIDAIAATSPVRTLAVTSTRSGEGKSLAAISLAVVSAMNVGRRVLLVDCDLRMPTVGRSLGLRPEAGLAEVLLGEASPEEAILRVEGTELDVLPVRGIPQNPAELLASDRMAKLLEELAGRYDRVILDLPCTLGLPDAKTVSGLCDGLVFVVRADHTPEEEVSAAIDVLDRRRILGVVLNGVNEDQTYGSYAYY